MKDLCYEIQKFGKSIGSVPRYRILHSLAESPKTVSQLVRVARLSQPAVSQHLKLLKACGLVSSKRSGQEIIYSINATYAIDLLKNIIQQIKK